MIVLYYHKHYHQVGLCDICQELEKYIHIRSDKYPFREIKTFCCVHCFQPKMREQIKKVIRYSGVRLIFTHLFLSVSHIKRERDWR